MDDEVFNEWSTKEKYILACCVSRSGDQNWVSVSRTIKLINEACGDTDNRQTDWFAQKNCAIKYNELLGTASSTKRKSRGASSESVNIETPAEQILRKLTFARIEELNRSIETEKEKFKKLKADLQKIQSGKIDDDLPGIWESIQSGQVIPLEKLIEDDHPVVDEKTLKKTETNTGAPTNQNPTTSRPQRATKETEKFKSYIEQRQKHIAKYQHHPSSTVITTVTSTVTPAVVSSVTPPAVVTPTTTLSSIQMSAIDVSPSKSKPVGPSPAQVQKMTILPETTAVQQQPARGLLLSKLETSKPLTSPTMLTSKLADNKESFLTNLLASPTTEIKAQVNQLTEVLKDPIKNPHHVTKESYQAYLKAQQPSSNPNAPMLSKLLERVSSSSSVTSSVKTVSSAPEGLLIVSTKKTPVETHKTTDKNNADERTPPNVKSSVLKAPPVKSPLKSPTLKTPSVKPLPVKSKPPIVKSPPAKSPSKSSLAKSSSVQSMSVKEPGEGNSDPKEMMQSNEESLLTTKSSPLNEVNEVLKVTEAKLKEKNPKETENIQNEELVLKSHDTLNKPPVKKSNSVKEEKSKPMKKLSQKTGEKEVLPDTTETITEVVDDAAKTQTTITKAIEDKPIEEPPKKKRIIEQVNDAPLQEPALERSPKVKRKGKGRSRAGNKKKSNTSNSNILNLDLLGEEESSQSTNEHDISTESKDAISELDVSDDVIDKKVHTPLTPMLSAPASPALSTGSNCDPELAQQQRSWRKSIMLVWKAAASHKYANVFLHPVTDEEAPGYSSIIFKPMDLSLIKKNIETGVTTSTTEFQRDIMLMFQNALMYNRKEHDVYRMAQEMRDDVMEQIQSFVSTQLMVQTTTEQRDPKLLRGKSDVPGHTRHSSKSGFPFLSL